MATPRPYGGTSVARLTASVNRANNKNLKYGIDFTFGVPQAFVGEARNAKIDVIPLKNLDKVKTATVYYTRLPIDVLNSLPSSLTTSVDIYSLPFSIHEILPRINVALGLDLVPGEVENTVYEDEADSYTLTIKEGCLAWTPSSVDFNAVHSDGVPLSSIITVTTLNGLYYNEQ